MAGLHQERPLTWGPRSEAETTSSLEKAGMAAGSSQQSVHTAHAGIRVDHSQAQPLSSDLIDVDTEGDRRNQPAHRRTAGNSHREIWGPGTLVLDLALLCYITDEFRGSGYYT